MPNPNNKIIVMHTFKIRILYFINQYSEYYEFIIEFLIKRAKFSIESNIKVEQLAFI